jgi:hypothetical protein
MNHTIRVVRRFAFTALLAHSAFAQSTTTRTGAQIIEAEDCVFTGTVDEHCCWRNILRVDATHSTHSGKGWVDFKNELGSHIEFTFEAQSAGPHALLVRYTHHKPDNRTARLQVNGMVVNPSISFPPTGAWTAWQSVPQNVEFRAGRNVVRLTALTAEGLANIDHFKIRENRTGLAPSELPLAQIVEAENCVFTGLVEIHCCWRNIAMVDAPHAGVTGRGLIDLKNEVGSHIEFTFDAQEAGLHTLGVRYVHPKPDQRPAEVRVNGEVANPSLEFPNTGAWTVWKYVTTPVQLRAGRNSIRLSALKAEGLTNLDHFAIARVP